MNYCDYLFSAREEWLDNPVLVDFHDERSFTYRELQGMVQVLGHYLRKIGYRPGEIIATHLYNGAEAVIAHLAIQYAGCVSCLLDPLITAKGLPYYLRDSNAQCLITHLPKDKAEEHIATDIQVIPVTDWHCLYERLPKNNNHEPAHNFKADELAAIFYTSGTTSQPKGVMLCHKNFQAHYCIFDRVFGPYSAQDRLLCFVPFSHGYGSKSIFIPCLKSGAAVVMMRSFHPFKVVEAIEKYRITHLFGVPSHYQQLLRKAELLPSLKKLKAAFSAAALLKPETAREWYEKVGFYLDEGYGLIETCTGVAFRVGALPRRAGHIGTYPADLVHIEILDDQDRVLTGEERGEIAIRGDSVMLGYLNKEEETRRVLRKGWFRSGDMGYKTADDHIIMTGRIKDVINVAGIKVAPFEIEAIINEHPAVVESAVIGVDDETYGEVVRGFVKLKPAAQVDERDLKKYLQDRLINFQIPKEIVFIDDFPRNTMGKIDKNALRHGLI